MSSIYEPYLRRYLNDNGVLWSSEQIARFALRAEQEICNIHPAVSIRSQIPIEENNPLYDIPTNQNEAPSLGINQITYKGYVLTALSLEQAHRLLPNAVISESAAIMSGAFEASAFNNDAFFVKSVDSSLISDLAKGRPEYWWYSGYHEKTIQLYPCPNETITFNSSINEQSLWTTEIANYCIVEYRTVSFGNGTYKQPLWRFVRALIRDYVLAEAFAIEGKGQQIREAIMLRKRFNQRLELYRVLAHNVFVANKHRKANQFVPSYSSNYHRLNYGNDIGIRIR